VFASTVTTGGPSGDVGCVNGRRAFEAFLVLTHLSTDELLDPRDAVRARYVSIQQLPIQMLVITVYVYSE
jgi:hypothetical protein